jgi:hypothetical protein
MVHRRCYRSVVRWATLVLLALVGCVVGCLGGCNDLREFRGTWAGARLGDTSSVLRVGPGTSASLSIDRLDAHRLEGRLSIEGLLPETPISSLPGAEADVLAGLTFGGAPLRVFLAFAPVPDDGGEVLVVIALYDDHRVEVRVLRGGSAVYGIFALTEVGEATSRDGTASGVRVAP